MTISTADDDNSVYTNSSLEVHEEDFDDINENSDYEDDDEKDKRFIFDILFRFTFNLKTSYYYHNRKKVIIYLSLLIVPPLLTRSIYLLYICQQSSKKRRSTTNDDGGDISKKKKKLEKTR